MPSTLQRIAAEDHRAVSECIDLYGGLVWRLAKRYLDHAPQQIEDAVQDVFVELWMSAGRFDPAKGSEAAFVATLTHRRLIDVQRRVTSQRRRVKGFAEARGAGEWIASTDEPGESLLSAFEDLPAEERDALWLAIHSGMSHLQISQTTDAPVGTVKSRLRRGLLRLRQTLAGELTQPGEKGADV